MTSRPTARQSLAYSWRSLRSMRTALILLLLLALASIAGSLVPQTGVADARIAAMVRDHPLRSTFYRLVGLFDVYGSWWFTLITVLLLVSLFACLVPRTRAFVRNAFARPQPARELETMRLYEERAVALDPAEAIERARRILRRSLFRVNVVDGEPPQVAADKGRAREGGSLLFHWAFFLIVIGVVLGKGTGFAGRAVVVEGETWTEAHANYDGAIREGRWFGEAHTGAQLRVDDFEVTYRPDGSAEDFMTRGELLHADGSSAGPAEIRVNHPVSIDGVKFYQTGYGWAPVVVVEKDGDPIASAPVPFQQTPAPRPGIDQRSLPWIGVVRLPSLRQQVALEMQLWPSARALEQFLATGKSFPMTEADHPVIVFTAYEGTLLPGGNAATLDTSAMRVLDKGVVGEGRTAELPGGLTVGFPEMREYTVLLVSRDRGTPLMLMASVLVLLGLIPALYSARRKLWVRAEPAEGGAVVQVAGYAMQRGAQFEEEFARIVGELARDEGTQA